MCTGRILILALVSILEIETSNIPINHQAIPWSPYPQHQPAGGIFPKENVKVPKISTSPKKFYRKINPSHDFRYRRKKNHRWSDPREYKKFGFPKVSKYPRNPKEHYPIKNWNNQNEDTRNSVNSDLPSSYLKPPKTTENNYPYYENEKKSFKKQPYDTTHNRTVENPKNHRLEGESVEHQNHDDLRPAYVRDHAPEQQVEATDDNETNKSEERMIEAQEDAPGSSRDRIQYHIHGHAGPETYMFGFDTGDGDNRQFRMEERHEDGTVTGQYGYIDARGKLRKVRYRASPNYGYEEKHHEISEQDT